MSTWTSSPTRGFDQPLLPPPPHRKIVVLGYRGVGKSALVHREVYGRFLDTYEPTIDYVHRSPLEVKKVGFVLDVVDTSAQDEYSRLSRLSSVGVNGFVLAYSVTSRTSFDMVKTIRRKVLNAVGGEVVPIILVATKCDLTDYREVPLDEGRALAGKWGYPFVECSAKMNSNTRIVFEALVEAIEESIDSGLLEDRSNTSCILL